MYIEFTGIDYELREEKAEEIKQAQIDLFEGIEYEEDEGLTFEQAERMGIPLPEENNNGGKRKTSFLLKEEDYVRVEYEYFVRKDLVNEFYTNQDKDTVLKLETGELVTVKENIKETHDKLA